MKSARMESLAWVLIYGGAGLLMLGLWTLDSDALLGHGFGWTGGAVIAIGVLLIWLRSRRGNESRDGASE